jgi:transcriptional regulator NrdR family protein
MRRRCLGLRLKLLCPKCGENTTVSQTWGKPETNTIVRRRTCLACNYIFKTVEIPFIPPPVLSRNAKRRRDKLYSRSRREQQRAKSNA